MILLLAIGNFGEKYLTTRHSITLYMMIRYLQSPIRERECKHFASLKNAELYCREDNIYLAYSKTLMNNSAKALSELVALIGEPTVLVIFHDELDIAFSKIKLTRKMRDNGHNGIRSLMERIKFFRAKIERIHLRYGLGRGIGRETITHLLTRFDPSEKNFLNESGEKEVFGFLDAMPKREAEEEIERWLERWRNLANKARLQS